MSTVSQPKLQEDQRKQFIYMQNKAEKIIVKLDIQLDNILRHQQKQDGPNVFSPPPRISFIFPPTSNLIY